MERSLGLETIDGNKNQPTPAVFESALKRIVWQASRRPEAVAIVSGSETATFVQLLARASALSSVLRDRLAGTWNSPIAVYTDSTHDLIVAALAAWKVRCPYLPVGPSCPHERLRHMLTETGAPLILAPADSPIPNGAWEQIDIEEFTRRPLSSSDRHSVNDNGDFQLVPDDLAYIIYTSGSTGTPKGVAVTHGNLSNLISWYVKAFAVSDQDRATQIRALTFDVSVMEIWPHLSAGASVYSVDRSIYLFPERLRDYLVAQEITICEVPTVMAEHLLAVEWPREIKLRYLLTGGEALRAFPPSHLPFQLVNNYGPTECTVVTTSGIIGATDDGNTCPSIGRPIDGVQVFILDANLQPITDGQLGEIFVAGAGVAAGYIGRPDLTDERFVNIRSASGELRAYRTGDIGRRLSNGDLDFCGRVDSQIKLRGYRIEPAEIATALRRHASVSAVAISTIGEGAHKQLVAYVVPKSELSAADLREHLALHLPDYMIPELFVHLEQMPLTAHGKIDYSALPPPSDSISMEAPNSTLEPSTEIELEVASIFSKVLNQPHIGFTDNFFRCGGNSLLAAQVIANVQRSFGVDLPMRSIFDSPSVEGLAREIATQILELSA